MLLYEVVLLWMDALCVMLVLLLIASDMLDASTHLDGFMQLWSVNRQSDNTHWALIPQRLSVYTMVLFFGNTHWAEVHLKDRVVYAIVFFLATPIGRRYLKDCTVYGMVIYPSKSFC